MKTERAERAVDIVMAEVNRKPAAQEAFDASAGSNASLEDKLTWLVQEIRKTQNRIESQRVDALAQVANPPKSRHPEITEAKNRMRHQTLAEISERLKWLTGHHRPWMKHLNDPSSGAAA